MLSEKNDSIFFTKILKQYKNKTMAERESTDSTNDIADLKEHEVLLLRREFSIKTGEALHWYSMEPVPVKSYRYYLGDTIVNTNHRICDAADAQDALAFLGQIITEKSIMLRAKLQLYEESKGRAVAPFYAVFANMTRRQRGEQDKLFSVVRPD